MQRSREAFLIEFNSGGVAFATDASSLQVIADGNWQPPDSEPGESRVVLLAALLKLDARPATRTLVLETPDGTWGFGVDAITKDLIQLRSIVPVPELLADWLEPMVLSGLAVRKDTGRILSVLDLRRLVRLCSETGERVGRGEKR